MTTRYNDIEVETLRYIRGNIHAARRLNLPAECMLHPDTRNCLSQLKDLNQQDIKPTPAILSARGVPNQLVEAIKKDSPTDTPIDELVRLLNERYAKFFLDQKITQELQPGLRNGMSPQTAFSKMHLYTQQAQRYTLGENHGWTLDESLQDYSDRLRGVKRPANFVRLHLPWAGLKALMPGIMPDTPVGIAAYSSFGKSTMLDQMCEAWARQGHNGIYFDTELSQYSVSQRRIMRYSGVSVMDQAQEEETPGHLSKTQNQAIDNAIAQMAAWPGTIQHIQCSGWATDQIMAVIERLNDRRPWRSKNDRPISYVVFDYLNRLGRSDTDPFGLADLYNNFLQRLHSAAVRGNWIPIVSAQFDKASSDKPYPIMTDILYGGSAMTNYNKVCIIIDREMSKEKDERYNRGRFRAYKTTLGKTGNVPFVFDEDHLSFEEKIDAPDW